MRKALRQRKQVVPSVGGVDVAQAGRADITGTQQRSDAVVSSRVTRRLPPLPDGTGTGHSYSSLQQATVTNATFTLTPEGKGVATFEFCSLFPLPCEQRLSTPEATGANSSKVAASSVTESRQQAVSSPPTRADKAKRQTSSCFRGLKSFLQTASVIVAVTLLGNLVFSHLEVDTETQARADFTQRMLALRDRYNMTTADFEDILDQIGTPLEFDSDSQDRNWGATNSNSALFVFTIVSTIGYGNFAPQTDGGKIFLMAYAAFGIPIVTACVGNLASQFLGFVEWWAVAHMDLVTVAFNYYDTDGSGHLDEDEFFHALQDLQIRLSREEVRSVISWINDEGTRERPPLHSLSLLDRLLLCSVDRLLQRHRCCRRCSHCRRPV